MSRAGRAAVVALCCAGVLSATDVAPARAATAPGLLALVVTSDGLVPVELRTGQVRPTIPVPGALTAAVSPDGRTAWVLVANGLRPVDLVQGTAGRLVPVGVRLSGLSLSPSGDTAYVADRDRSTVIPIDTATRTPRPAYGLAKRPVDLAITPDGGHALLMTGYSDSSSSITSLELSEAYTNATAVPWCRNDNDGGYPVPRAVTVAPDGRTAYATDAYSACPATAFDVADGAARGPVGPGGARETAVTPDSRTVVVATGDTAFPGGTCKVFVVDAATGGYDPAGTPLCTGALAVSPSGDAAYLTTGQQGLVRLDLRTRRISVVAAGLLGPVVVTPDQAPTARLTVTPGPAGGRTVLDAGASTGATTAIATYRWAFGDGTTRTTTSPRVEHVYAKGSLTASVTVTSVAGTSTSRVWASTQLYRNGLPRAQATRTFIVR